jgi:hypothetical protein
LVVGHVFLGVVRDKLQQQRLLLVAQRPAFECAVQRVERHRDLLLRGHRLLALCRKGSRSAYMSAGVAVRFNRTNRLFRGPAISWPDCDAVPSSWVDATHLGVRLSRSSWLGGRLRVGRLRLASTVDLAPVGS